MSKRKTLRRVRQAAKQLEANGLTDEQYNQWGDDECSCCNYEEFELIPDRVRKRRKTRRTKFEKRARILSHDFSSRLCSDEGNAFDKSLGRTRRVRMDELPRLWEFQQKLQTAYNELIVDDTVTCPICAACEERDEEWTEKLVEAIEKVREYDDEYQRSDDNGASYSEMVSEYETEEAIKNWFDQLDDMPVEWSNLSDELRESIVDSSIQNFDSVCVSGYENGFDVTFASYQLGESENQQDWNEFVDEHELQGCPFRLAEACDELNVSAYRHHTSVTIYNNNEYEHWSFGMDTAQLVETVRDAIAEREEYDDRPIKRSVAIQAALSEAGGDDILEGLSLSAVYVCYADSIAGGNCRPGTLAYMTQYKLSGHMLASDMPRQSSHEVRKAIRAACLRTRDELAKGFSDLAYHLRGSELLVKHAS